MIKKPLNSLSFVWKLVFESLQNPFNIVVIRYVICFRSILGMVGLCDGAG